MLTLKCLTPKKFWKNVKPIFGNKSKGNKIIALEEGNEVITDDGKLAQTFNEIFCEYCSKPRYHFFSRE